MSEPKAYSADAGLDNIGSCIPWLRLRFQELGVKLDSAAVLQRNSQEAEHLGLIAHTKPVRTFEGPNGPEKAQAYYFRFAGADFLSKALHRAESHGVKLPRLAYRQFAKGNPLLTGPAPSSQARNRAWEYLLGALVSPFAQKVVFVEPPDVCCELDGSTVGLSAKVVYSSRSDEVLRDIGKGAVQLERSVANYGYVVVNLVHAFPHGQVMRNFIEADLRDPDVALALINRWMDNYLDGLGRQKIKDHIERNSKVRAVIWFLPTVVHLIGQPCPFNGIFTVNADSWEPNSTSFENLLNTSVQTVLNWRPSVTPAATALSAAELGRCS
jgi:hypothetical protein